MYKTNTFNPGGLRAPPMVADGIEAGHCFHLLFFGPGSLHVPHVVADVSKAGNTPGTAGGPGGRDRTLAVKSRKIARK